MSRVALGFAIMSTFARAAESPAQKVLTPFLDKYCLKCHDTATQKGDRDLDNFKFPLTNVASLITAKDIVDQLTLREMPPVKEKTQPSDDERLALIRVLRESIAAGCHTPLG